MLYAEFQWITNQNPPSTFYAEHDHHLPRLMTLFRHHGVYIAVDNQPFSIVQDARFTKLVEFLEPCYAMPSRKYFSDQCLPELYSFFYTHVEKLISGAVSIIFTTDIWSLSVNQVSMLSFTAQWLDEDFVLKKAVLHSQECHGQTELHRLLKGCLRNGISPR